MSNIIFSHIDLFRYLKLNNNIATINSSDLSPELIADIDNDNIWEITDYEAGGQGGSHSFVRKYSSEKYTITVEYYLFASTLARDIYPNLDFVLKEH